MDDSAVCTYCGCLLSDPNCKCAHPTVTAYALHAAWSDRMAAYRDDFAGGLGWAGPGVAHD